MESADSTTTASAAATTSDTVVSQEEHSITSVSEDHEKPCWGCGLRLLVSPYAPAFKCAWCGAITNENAVKRDNKCLKWKRLRDRCFVIVLIIFMIFIICGGIWAIYPVVFAINYYYGVLHLIIAVTLSISTISTFSFTAFRTAGASPNILWGSYPAVRKGGLENYTFCLYCLKPKSPRTHHCRSCGTCVLDMDHHCPFIGNCVGAANHRSFILFLISAVTSTVYVTFMSAYAAYHIWPRFRYGTIKPWPGVLDHELLFRAVREFIITFLSSMLFLPARALVLMYLFMSSVSVEIGLSVLLWQQLCYIYEGKTYLSHLSSPDSDEATTKDCENIIRFFGCPYRTKRYLPVFMSSSKSHEK
ncbi:PREDICTED: protein S-acyltransferase 11 [Ipomoea nil]|uniref:protein S-acyltransferase 11 n=1 Tax=Ipomoea nil TaxID=35883 RepID=UPI000900BF73|nr:PREDICTED: protein S-acyltransferase 11 [Ipomoea nil]